MEENETENVDKKIDDNLVKKKTTEDKVKFENINVEQELLGSVTTVNNPGLRTSARVIQKMKQDSIRPSTPPPTDKKDAPSDKGLQRTPSQTKPPKVIWSNFEKNLFFDALNELGKDFESIANFINSKIKRKTSADQSFKTKEQIRQIYYQTFHKLSKYLKFSDDVKKPAQELYALINYGEMRRKLAFVSEKNCMKIKDLVYKGHVTVRSKGKNIRIKTPPCKALRKLNQLDDWQEDINLPAKIEVCLKPANMDAWARVQSIAQNPLVQTTVPLQKKLVNVIKTFQYKWRNEETKLALQAFAMGKQNQNVKQDNKAPNEGDSASFQEPLLCLCPASDSVIHRPLISITEFLSSFSICLNSYEQKIGVKVRGETLSNKRQRSDSGCEKKSPESKKVKAEPDSKLAETNNCNNINPDDCDDKEEKKEPKVYLSEVSNSNHSNPEDCHDLLLNDGNMHRSERQDSKESENAKKFELLINSDNAVSGFVSSAPRSEDITPEVVLKSSSDVKPRKKDIKCAGSKKKDTKNITNLKPLLDEDTERKIRKGWTVQNASDISVGDLYITFGHDSKITFEYYWIKKDVEKHSKKERSSIPYNINSVDEESLKAIRTSNICNKLRHLLLIASLTERVKKKPCSCGHVCEKGVKHKKGDAESCAKTFVSNKTYTTTNSDCVFRQPAAPHRRQGLENFRLIQNGFRYNHARLLVKSRSLASKQVVVQRLLPVQPGMNQSYDVVTPQVHVRTIVEKPSVLLQSWPDNEEIETNIVNTEKEVVNTNGNTVQNKPAVTLEDNANDCEVDSPQENLTISHADANCRPFMALGRNDELPSPGNSTGSLDKNDTPKSLDHLISLSTKDDIFSSTSSDASVIESNRLQKIISLGEDPGIQQLMEIPLPSPAPPQCLDDSDICSIPPMSPMRLIRESPSDPKWLEENFNDFSLSSFLGHLDEMNRDVDTMSVISESSQDYMTKFAEIAASMQNEDKDL